MKYTIGYQKSKIIVCFWEELYESERTPRIHGTHYE